MNTHRCTVEEEDAGVRLDKFLATALPLSRARIQQLVEEGHVRRNGAVQSNSATKVKTGETFEVTEPEIVPLDLTPANIPLTVIYEDNDLLVIDKPPGMTVHPAPGAGASTLVHALLAHCGDTLSGIGGVARPGIVHRIDKDTSGLLVVAKHDLAHQHLSAQLKSRTLKRHYLCYSWGTLVPRSGEIDAPLGRNPRMRKQMAVVENGKHALTHYHTETIYMAKGTITPLASKIACELDTGRTHQIRVHLAHKRCPLIGDSVYGIAPGTRANRLKTQHIDVVQEKLEFLLHFPRQALHAAKLRLIHPQTSEEMEFFSQIPADLRALEATLATLTG
jgi:23S rRNA pseudouridine1911/1915/1917 synthase